MTESEDNLDDHGFPQPQPPAHRSLPPRPERPPRANAPYNAPPRIRVTGEVPAVTGEVPADDGMRGPVHPGRAPTPDSWSSGGSVVDRPAPSPPDWMSGVQVPELLVTRDLDPSDRGDVRTDGSLAATVQRLAGLVLVAILVAVVVLVLVGSVTDLGSGLR